MEIYAIVLIDEIGRDMYFEQNNRIVYYDDRIQMKKSLNGIKSRYGGNLGKKYKGRKVVAYRVESYETYVDDTYELHSRL